MTCCSKSLDGTNSQIRRRPCAASSIMRQPTAIGRQSSEKCAAGAAAKAALSGIGADRLSLAPILLLLKRKDRAIAAGPVGRQEARARVVMCPARRLAAHDLPHIPRLQRIIGVG